MMDRKNHITNPRAWAIGTVSPFRMGRGTRFRIRRIVWGRLMARSEKRDGEVIRKIRITAAA